MGKFTHQTRRNGNNSNTTNNSQASSKMLAAKANKNEAKHITGTPLKDKSSYDTAISHTVSPTPKKSKLTLFTDASNEDFGAVLNSDNEYAPICPLSVPLTELFGKFPPALRAVIQGYASIDRAFEMEDNKAIDIHIKMCVKFMDTEESPICTDCYNLFIQSFTSDAVEADPHIGSDIRDLGLNLAASDRLALFAPIEVYQEGNLNATVLAHAWADATARHGTSGLGIPFL
jgi:hypothetical protein